MGTGVTTVYAPPLVEIDHVAQMIREGRKFDLNKLVMTARDKDGKVFWLEQGDKDKGLKHILDGNGTTKGHADDLENTFGVSRNQVPAFLKYMIQNGNRISYKPKLLQNGKTGLEMIYDYGGKHYLLVGSGTNGFIVTSYPVEI